MDTSILIARLVGPLFMLVGASALFNRAAYRMMIVDFSQSSGLYYFSGACAFVIGMAIVLFHNIWVADWRVVITVLGWLSIIKGVLRVLFPTAAGRVARQFVASDWPLVAGAVVTLAVGGWLTLMSFVA